MLVEKIKTPAGNTTPLSRRPRENAWVRLVAVAAAVVAMLAGGGVAAPQASAEPTIYVPGGRTLTFSEVAYCLSHAADCINGDDAGKWAESVSAGTYPELDQHNTKADAFRHCLWTGAMAQRMGRSGALAIADNHEVQATQPAGEASMDSHNNVVGASLGEQSNSVGTSDTWGWILDQCYQRAESGSLYGLNGERLSPPGNIA